jgi:integrase
MPKLKRWRAADMAKGYSYVVSYYGKPVQDVRNAWDAAAIEAGHAKQKGLDAKGQPIWEVPDSPHILRHSSVTWLLQDGVPAFEVAGFAAMDIETLQSVYGHHAPDFQQRVATAHGRRTSAQDSPKKPAANGVNERHVVSTKLSKF